MRGKSSPFAGGAACAEMLNKPAHKKIAQARGCDEPVLANLLFIESAFLLLHFGDALAEGLHGELGLFGVDH